MRGIVLLLGCLTIISSGAQAGELYRWMDSKGVMHYSDTPPPKSEQAESIRFSTAAGSDESLPYETRRAKQNFPVTLYVGVSCGEACSQARSLLSKRGIPFTENLVKTKEDLDALKQLTGIVGTPVLAVGKTYLGGFQAEQWQSELDVAGYPKTAPYRAPSKSAPEPVKSDDTDPDAASEVPPANPGQ